MNPKTVSLLFLRLPDARTITLLTSLEIPFNQNNHAWTRYLYLSVNIIRHKTGATPRPPTEGQKMRENSGGDENDMVPPERALEHLSVDKAWNLLDTLSSQVSGKQAELQVRHV